MVDRETFVQVAPLLAIAGKGAFNAALAGRCAECGYI